MVEGLKTDLGWGQLSPIPGTFAETEVEGRRQQTLTYRWTSGPALRPFLGPHFPDGISLDFVCTTIGNERRWSPVLSGYELFGRASVAGLAVLRSCQELTPHEVQSHHLMRLLFQRSPRVVERLDYRIRNVKDLKISAIGAHHLIGIANPGGQKRGQERRIVIKYLQELMKEGRNAAREAGATNPGHTGVSLAYGIDLAAERYVSERGTFCPEEFQLKLRLALFGAGPVNGEIGQSLQDRIELRLIEAIQSHLGDSTDQFDTWFFERFNDVVKQIANRKHPGGTIDRDIVRQVLLNRVTDSWDYVGACMSYCMLAVKSTIAPTLTRGESDVFSALYTRNRYSGRIPLIMLQEYVPILRPTIAALLDRPMEEFSWIRLQRALEIYSGILLAHRESDRKRSRPLKPPASHNGDGRSSTASQHKLRQQADNSPMSICGETLKRSQQEEAFETIIKALPACGCGNSDWERAGIVDATSALFVDMAFRCQDCGAEATHRFAAAATRRAAPRQDQSRVHCEGSASVCRRDGTVEGRSSES